MNDSAERWQTLVDVDALAAALGRDDLVVLDARVSLADRSAGEAWYREGHVPGARFADLDRDLSDHARTGGRHPWPGADDFTARLGRWGITPSHQVVVYDAGDGALAAARAWFLLRALGHRDVAVLDGGWKAWTERGGAVQTDVPVPARAEYDAGFDRARLLDAEGVQAHLDGGGMLVDARAGERFRGEVEPLDRAAGHVPGAVNRPYADNLQDGRFKPAGVLAREFGELLDGRDAGDVAVMCGSGVTACHHLLAMEHAGLPGAKLFTGSWSGWLEDPARPVATGA
ncbi:sulfurtransferase [Lysobacter arseniciresistens ZS79]|uniref:Sulfurtransferase n=1 Tax=Lysobacter arseniciresistens ZS79 TaxID=913325 RepID=A0A0A0F2G5_9GAMM|nr:sulfurtransferase [Lysobacter arseniciresistens]KGM56533.1 sulfurtransferase [Lysobacter arseniciresistens ZS79]